MTKHARLPAASPARGVTLLELMVVLAVLAVLAMAALPSMAGMQQRHRLVAAAEALAADLSEARFEAARSGQTLHVQSRTGADNGWCWSVASQAGCSCAAGDSGDGGASMPAAPSCRLKTVRGTDHPGIQLLQPLHAQLQAQGQAGGMVRTELQSRQGQRLRVELSALGRTQICEPDSAGSSPVGRYLPC